MVVQWDGVSLLITLVSCHRIPDIQLKMSSTEEEKAIIPLHRSLFWLCTHEESF